MGKFNTFRPLKQVPGVRQITDVNAYKKAPEALTGEGLCAAMSMHWLQVGVPPTTQTELTYCNRLQKAYVDKLAETKNNTGETIAFLADRCGFELQGRLPEGRPVEAKQWWANRFGDGGTLASKKFSSVIAGGISAYANEQLNSRISWEPGAADTQELLPCYIWVHLHCPSITLMGETLEQSPTPVDFEDEDGKTRKVVFNNERLKIDGEKIAVFGGPHAVALERGTGGNYIYFDPDAVYECYKNFNAASREEWAENGLVAEDVDLQLVRIYPVQPEEN
jgi:hypothetical protein